MKIAIVGSGIAGLTCAHGLVRAGHNVTVFEARRRPALLAHTPEFTLGGRAYTIDSLVVWEGYSKSLVRLAREAGLTLALRTFDSTSLAQEGEPRPYAAYRSTDLPLARLNLPLPRTGSARASLALGALWLRLLLRGWRAHRRVGPEVSVGEFFRDEPPERYRRQVYPWLSGFLGFVGADATRRTPAAAVIEFFAASVFHRPRMVSEGLTELACRLLRGATFRPATRVRAVVPEAGGVSLTAEDQGGTAAERFDHVVLAVPPHGVPALVEGWSDAERRFFDGFQQCEIALSMHTDASLLPAARRDWCTLNYRLHADPAQGVELTLWANAAFDILEPAPVMFSWNPVRPPAPESVLYRTQLTRVLPTVEVQEPLRSLLPALQGRRNLWFCGTWAWPGRAAYLEDGVRAAQAVVTRLQSAQ